MIGLVVPWDLGRLGCFCLSSVRSCCRGLCELILLVTGGDRLSVVVVGRCLCKKLCVNAGTSVVIEKKLLFAWLKEFL